MKEKPKPHHGAGAGTGDAAPGRSLEVAATMGLLPLLPPIIDLAKLLEWLRKKDPWYPPCEGAVIRVAVSGWRCYKGYISFVDTITWQCPDGSTVTKEGASKVTDQECQ